MVVIGDKEAELKTVSPRARSGQNLGAMDLKAFVQKVQTESVPGYKE
jgi:threonyl-tRNA synthetase